jgi:hypothetical protein
MARYDQDEINRAFTRIPCMSCTNWRADAVKAKVALALINNIWDGRQDIKPPTSDDLKRCCCRHADEHDKSFTLDVGELQNARIQRGEPLPP